MNEFLHALLNSLNCIEVKGKDNLDTMLGCIMAIERKIAEIENEEEVREDG